MAAWVNHDVKERLKGVPEERRIPPDPTVVVPALLALSYSMEKDNLRNMYANLLAKSMDSATAGGVHPSFVDVVTQLTPDEGRMLGALAVNDAHFYDIYFLGVGTRDYVEEKVGVSELFGIAKCETVDSERQALAISNLERLELIVFEPEERPAGGFSAVGIVQPYIQRLVARNGVTKISVRNCRLTAFGRGFCSCCVGP